MLVLAILENLNPFRRASFIEGRQKRFDFFLAVDDLDHLRQFLCETTRKAKEAHRPAKDRERPPGRRCAPTITS